MKKLTTEEASARLRSGGILSIIRGRFTTAQLRAIADALVDAGVTALEITLNSPAALQHISALRRHMGPRAMVGAGTVRTALQVHEAITAGAQFLVSPGFDPASVLASQEAGILHLPGVLTPSEVQQSVAAGCRFLKLFPADTLGPGYLRSIRAPFDDVDFIPTGGVTAKNIGLWRAAGAAAVAAGSTLVTGPDQPLIDVMERAGSMRQAWEAADGD